jgi:glycosyltransferase involved in cell wall biosynthesis
LIDEKGVDVLLDAAALAPEVPVGGVGDGPDLAALEARAKDMPNVEVVGPAWGDALKIWLAGARAVVVPSLWHENFPYVILQAFAAGLPVIGSKRGGIPEMLEAGDFGWTYEAKDPEALAALLKQVKTMPNETIGKMGEAAQAYVVQEFSDTRIYARLQEIYKRVLA